MPTPEQIKTLVVYRTAAVTSGHIFPEYAACEAVMESKWGISKLATLAV